MGSFNTTCFFSQQTISPGTEAYLFPIQQGQSFNPVKLEFKGHEKFKASQYSFSSSLCSPTGLWGISGPMLEGTYDDYGYFEVNDTSSNIRNLHSLFKHLLENAGVAAAGKNSSHETPFDISTHFQPKTIYSFEELVLTWEYVWTAMQNGRIFIQVYNGAIVPFSFAVMHKVAGDYLINEVATSKTWDNSSMEQSQYFNRYINENFERAFEVFPNKTLIGIIDFVSFKVAYLESFGMGQFEGCYTCRFYDSNVDKLISTFEQYFEANPSAKTVDTDTTNLILAEMADYVDFLYLLSGLSRFEGKFSPMTYGGQDYQNQNGNRFLKMIKAINKDINKLVKSKN